MRKSIILHPILICLILIYCAGHYGAQQGSDRFCNVIVLVPDGCGVAHMTLARWFKGALLTQDSMDVSLVRTHSANSMITESAAAATAFSTGFKTWEGSDKAKCLSMRPDSLLFPEPVALPESEQWRPVATVLEAARLSGRSTGLVATCRISHATPAAYASHWHSRDYNNIIMEQIVHQGVDVVFAGGYRYLVGTDTEVPGSKFRGARRDGDDLKAVLLSKGYGFITTREELLGLDADTKKVWGMFAPSHMVHDIDRRYLAPHEPSLAEMTEKAIEILNRDPDGFFLVVEGSQVDWASHDNDPVGVVTEYLAFDRAVKVALDFARSDANRRTLVLIFPDHECGGMSLGERDTDPDACQPERTVDVLRKARLTADGVATFMSDSVGHGDTTAIRAMLSHYYAIDDLTDDELRLIQDELCDTPYVDIYTLIGPMLSRRCSIGWTTFSHTGGDVPMFSYGLGSFERTLDNTEIAYICAHALELDLGATTERLFSDAAVLFDDHVVTIDTIGWEKSMGQLIVETDGRRALFPFFKNVMVVDQDTVMLEGLTIYSLKAHKVFLPRQAKALFDRP